MKEKIIFILIIVLIFLTLLDIPLTFLGIDKFGMEAEGNPVARNLIENGGWILLKGGVSFVLILFGLLYIKLMKKNLTKPLYDNVLLTILIFPILIHLYASVIWILELT